MIYCIIIFWINRILNIFSCKAYCGIMACPDNFLPTLEGFRRLGERADKCEQYWTLVRILECYAECSEARSFLGFEDPRCKEMRRIMEYADQEMHLPDTRRLIEAFRERYGI